MTVEQIEATLTEIETAAYDDEEAHALEKNLWEDVLKYISADEECHHHYRWLAKTALKSKDIKFSRWFA